MEKEFYDLPENPEYIGQIRALRDSDPAQASTVFNPLVEKLIHNTHFLKLLTDEMKTHLSNKANLWQAFEGSARVPDSGINAELLTTQGVYYFTSIAATASTNVAYSAAHIMVALRMGTRILQIAVRYGAPGHMSFRTSADGAWLSWAVIATATPPTEYPLPLAEGLAVYQNAYYFKTQESIVMVALNFKAITDQANGTVVTTLPVGFRPPHNIEVVASFGQMLLRPNGNIYIYGTRGLLAGTLGFAEFPPYVATSL